MKIWSNNHVDVLAGSGNEGVNDGKGEVAQFYQVTSMSCQNGKNIYTADVQAGSIRIITTMSGAHQFLSHLGKLYEAFNVHIKGQPFEKQGLAGAIGKVREVNNYLVEIIRAAKEDQNLQKATNGPEGTVSKKTVSSVNMILTELLQLQNMLAVNPAYIQEIDMHSCLTICVENLHAVAHFKDQTMTMLQYACNLGNTVSEGIK